MTDGTNKPSTDVGLLCTGKKGTYKVWTCKLVVSGEVELPQGFDWPPRKGATEAVANSGIEVLGCFSGWGDSLTEGEIEVLERHNAALNDRPEKNEND